MMVLAQGRRGAHCLYLHKRPRRPQDHCLCSGGGDLPACPDYEACTGCPPPGGPVDPPAKLHLNLFASTGRCSCFGEGLCDFCRDTGAPRRPELDPDLEHKELMLRLISSTGCWKVGSIAAELDRLGAPVGNVQVKIWLQQQRAAGEVEFVNGRGWKRSGT